MNAAHHLILLGGVLGLLSIFAGLLSGRLGTPLLLVFLSLGMLAGREGPVGLVFDDLRAAYLIGSAALAVILFEGGLKTHDAALRAAFWPALTLATLGVALTAGVVAIVFCGLVTLAPPTPAWPHPVWTLAVLVGASVAPTDAAAVSMLLSRSRVLIPLRLSALLEIESGLNDPVSVFLTASVTAYILAPSGMQATQAVALLGREMAGGALLGAVGGWLLVRALRRIRSEAALCPVLALMGAFALFGLAQSLGASGFLALYIAGIVVGRGIRNTKVAMLEFFTVFGWLAQIVLFLMLGLLIVPHKLIEPVMLTAVFGVVLITVTARAAACFACLLPFGFSLRETIFASWVGLRGAVPIYLTIIPALSGVAGAEFLLTPTFVVVVTSLVIQGWTIGPVAKLLGFSRIARQKLTIPSNVS